MNKPLSILVVDDDPLNLQVAEVILKSAGHVVSVALDGAEAVARCIDQGQRYDLILMDLNMPVMSGLEATKLLRAHPELETTPIVFVTGSGDFERQAMEAGADRYFTKPYRRQQLLDFLATTFVERGLLAPGESFIHQA
ncbi:MAG: response regulator [Candidatus Sericytochromatia bacterium]